MPRYIHSKIHTCMTVISTLKRSCLIKVNVLPTVALSRNCEFIHFVCIFLVNSSDVI